MVKRMLKYIIILSFFISGCALYSYSTEVKKEKVMDVNIQDGIDKKEAFVIAQEEMKKRGLDKGWKTEKPKLLSDDNDNFYVKFYSRQPSAFDLKKALPYLVTVSKEDGRIIGVGLTK